MNGVDPVTELDYWTIPIIIIFSFTQLMLLGFILALTYKLDKVARQLHEVSRDAGKFLRMSMNYFKGSGSK